MGEKDVNQILIYKRPFDSWLCPECDTENKTSTENCAVCGYKKTYLETILNQYSEPAPRPIVPPAPTPSGSTPSGPIFKDIEGFERIPDEEDGNKNKMIWGIIIAIIIFGLIIAAIQTNIYATYGSALQEFNCGNYKTAINMLEDLPLSYKDVSYMLTESKYQCALEHLNSEDFTSAESLFESIIYYSDSAEKLNERNF